MKSEQELFLEYGIFNDIIYSLFIKSIGHLFYLFKFYYRKTSHGN